MEFGLFCRTTRVSQVTFAASIAMIAVAFFLASACQAPPSPQPPQPPQPRSAGEKVAHADTLVVTPAERRAPTDGSAGDASATAADSGFDAALVETDPMDNHHDTRDELLGLFSLRDFSEEEEKRIRPNAYLRSVIGPEGPGRMNQGNKAIARHLISKEKCLAGLKNIVIQTPEQRAQCGAENMVPAWAKGKEPTFCIDVFEFPNKACELPFVWTAPAQAKTVCELQGKRLCAQQEWNLSCRGDPNGGEDQRYAYGDKVDIDICHTNLRHRLPCNPNDARSAFNTCTTDTEPSGSFPKCRSRFGVFDQHGNVAEVMSRREGDKTVTQLKGSAWFYNELVREPGEPVPETTTNKSGAYPDHCNFDPRWHVEPLNAAGHVNYHLGFRCCKSIP